MQIRRKRRDPLHAPMMRVFADAGCSVYDTADVGGGFSDFIAASGPFSLYIEVKSPPGPRGGISGKGRSLNPKQTKFAATWKGYVIVEHSLEKAAEDAGWLIGSHRRWRKAEHLRLKKLQKEEKE